MKRIALLCPSLKRPERKMALINSLIETVKDTKNITLFMGIDKEGDETLTMMKQTSKTVSFLRVIELGNECKGRIHKCWNVLAKIAYDEGYNILALTADDFLFKTYRWDEMILDEFSGNKLPADKWKLVTCNDGFKNGHLPINYFVDRKYYEIIGYIASEKFVICWCDNYIKTHFTPFNRYFYRPDIMIYHNHWCYSKDGIPDQVGLEMLQRKNGSEAECDDMWPKTESQRVEEVLKIAKFTGLKPDFKQGEFSEKYWKPNPKLSILICSLYTRVKYLNRLKYQLEPQIKNQPVEVLVSIDNGENSIGDKRNTLLKAAKGDYVAYIDDDDAISSDYVELILKAIETKPDCVGIVLEMQIDGKNPQRSIHSIRYDHWFDEPDKTDPPKREYFRCPNHISPILREHALKVGFPSNCSMGEDKYYSDHIFPLLKTEVYIDKPIYYYLVRTNKDC